MDRRIADELYSHILPSSDSQLGQQSFTVKEPITSVDYHGDDLWGDDEALQYGSEKGEDMSFMDREWQRRHDKFHTIGYRDGVTAGKEASAQEGFNVGFKESVFVGQRWGIVRGVTSALACLPDGLKERLIPAEERRNKFQNLYESVHALSTRDALVLFHHGLKDNLIEQEENMQLSSETVDLQRQSSERNVLENYVQEFESLETSAIKVQLAKDLRN